MAIPTTPLSASSLRYRRGKYFASAEAWRRKNPGLARIVVSKAHAKAKDAAFKALGGYRCVACGYDAERVALQIDHVDGNGTEERRQLKGSSYNFYRLVARCVEKYQVLCANCNIIKKMRNREFGRRFLGE